MPIYEYQCSHCGERFEVRQAIGEDGSTLSCPQCHASEPKRIVSSFFSRGANGIELPGTSCPTCSSGTCGLAPMD